MNCISQLEPVSVWKIFSDICKIPHPSGHEAALAEYVMNTGRECGCEVRQDSAGNVLLIKAATPGMENCKTVILQAHMDMVPQKNDDFDFDFLKDAIVPLICDGKVTADRTTLGADNGTGVATALAAVKENIAHGPLRCVFTVEEETGLVGASKLAPEFVAGDILINLDGNISKFYIGCAGGTRSNYKFAVDLSPVPENSAAVRIMISGLKGGHSGADINKGRGNSHKEAVWFLRRAMERFDLRLSSIDGGTVDNAIPRETFMTVVLPESDLSALREFTDEYASAARERLGVRAPEFKIDVTPIVLPSKIFSTEFQHRLLSVLNECPDGVIAMSRVISGLVETSTNLAVLKTDADTVIVRTSQRSSKDAARHELVAALAGLFSDAGAKVVIDNEYPGWEPDPESEILKIADKVYCDKFKEMPEHEAIHAGLECGIIGALNRDLELISFGAEVIDPHSPDEAVDIASVGKSWELLCGILENIPEK